jgi:hypothetical protein
MSRAQCSYMYLITFINPVLLLNELEETINLSDRDSGALNDTHGTDDAMETTTPTQHTPHRDGALIYSRPLIPYGITSCQFKPSIGASSQKNVRVTVKKSHSFFRMFFPPPIDR